MIEKYLTIKDRAVGLIPGMRWALTSAVPTTGDVLIYDGSAWVAASPTQSATIASGAVTVSGPGVHLLAVDTEGAAASDDLVTISGGTAGQRITLIAANTARTVVVKSTGNIDLSSGGGDMSLDSNVDTITLVYDAASSMWLETARSANG